MEELFMDFILVLPYFTSEVIEAHLQEFYPFSWPQPLSPQTSK